MTTHFSIYRLTCWKGIFNNNFSLKLLKFVGVDIFHCKWTENSSRINYWMVLVSVRSWQTVDSLSLSLFSLLVVALLSKHCWDLILNTYNLWFAQKHFSLFCNLTQTIFSLWISLSLYFPHCHPDYSCWTLFRLTNPACCALIQPQSTAQTSPLWCHAMHRQTPQILLICTRMMCIQTHWEARRMGAFMAKYFSLLLLENKGTKTFQLKMARTQILIGQKEGMKDWDGDGCVQMVRDSEKWEDVIWF